MHTNVVGVVKTRRNPKKVAQKGSKDMVQDSKAEVENRTMRDVMKGKHKRSREYLEVIDKVSGTKSTEGIGRKSLVVLEVEETERKRHTGCKNVQAHQKDGEVAFVLTPKKRISHPSSKERRHIEEMFTSWLSKVNNVHRAFARHAICFWTAFHQVAVCGRDDTHASRFTNEIKQENKPGTF